jgi:hypothetical protein
MPPKARNNGPDPELLDCVQSSGDAGRNTRGEAKEETKAETVADSETIE